MAALGKEACRQGRHGETNSDVMTCVIANAPHRSALLTTSTSLAMPSLTKSSMRSASDRPHFRSRPQQPGAR